MASASACGGVLRRRQLTAAGSVSAAALAYAAHSPRAFALIAAGVAAVLVVLSATDLERRIIPNRIVLPASGAVLVAQLAISPTHAGTCVLAGLGAATFFAVPGLINAKLIGMGDAKLALLMGLTLGAKVVPALFIGLLSILPVALVVVIRGGWAARKTSLPFGPFLAFGALVILVAPLFR